ncbi:MAG: hypothetical protein HFJ47_00365 [Clostridia bacterium]|nr:hypothetical protein [Clostridia bacterium]
MKNKILTTIIGIIFSIFLVTVFAIPTYAEADIEANVILERDVNADNKIQVSLETSQNQSIASFNISLLVETVNVQDIKNVKIDWNSDISNNVELKELTYSNNKINIYVVSKNELGNDNGSQRIIEIGSIIIETENKDTMNVVIRAHKDLTTIASIGHESGVITNDISTMVQLHIAPRVSDGNQGGDNTQGGNDNQGSNNQGGSTSGGNNNQGGNGNQNGNNSQDVNDSSQDENNLNGDINQENSESKPNDSQTGSSNKNETNNIAQGSLPKAGAMVSNIIIFSVIAIGVVLLITIIIIKAKARQGKNYKIYK